MTASPAELVLKTGGGRGGGGGDVGGVGVKGHGQIKAVDHGQAQALQAGTHVQQAARSIAPQQ